MIKKIILLTLFIISLLNAKSITGMDGARVTVPNNPKRVVSLSDWKITAVLVELGVNVVGSAGHINKVTGKPFIRAASSMFDIDFSNSNIEYLGSSKAPDLEKITALKPDLIIGLNRHIKIKKQLSKIAPVVIIELNGDWMNTYKVIADATSKTKTFKKKLSRYKKQIRTLKRKYKRPSSISVSVIRSSKDEFSVERDNFIQKVLDDIGFKHPKGMKQVERGEDGKDFGIEAIKQFNTTYILDMYSPHKGETEKSKMSSKSAEAIKRFTTAGKRGRYFIVNRNTWNAISFKSLDNVIKGIPKLIK